MLNPSHVPVSVDLLLLVLLKLEQLEKQEKDSEKKKQVRYIHNKLAKGLDESSFATLQKRNEVV